MHTDSRNGFIVVLLAYYAQDHYTKVYVQGYKTACESHLKPITVMRLVRIRQTDSNRDYNVIILRSRDVKL